MLSRKASRSAAAASIESLEKRLLLSVNITSYGNTGSFITNVNLQETTLTNSDVNTAFFGKQYSVAVDGNVYAQPLVQTGVVITSGVNTAAGASGIHDVAFVATENDSIYAIDTASGTVLWHRSFLTASAGNVTGTDINGTSGTTAIAAIPAADTGSTDISPTVGITGTPVIDAANNCLYVIVATKETTAGVTNWVQRLHAISLNNGTDAAAPFLISDLSLTGTIDTPIYTYGTGAGSVTDPYNHTSRQVVQLNALRELQQGGLSLQNGVLYADWTTFDNLPPSHGWLADWSTFGLAFNGFTLRGVFNVTPNGGGGGISLGGGVPAFINPSTFYFSANNGTGAGSTYLPSGFPLDGNYDNSAVELVLDGTTSARNQGTNGWGFRVQDFFTPFNRAALDVASSSIGTGGVNLVSFLDVFPTGEALVVAGQGGKVYLLNPNFMGKFNSSGDAVLDPVTDGMGHTTAANVLGSAGSFSTPIYYPVELFWATGVNGPVLSFNPQSTGTVTSTTITNFGDRPGSPFISSSNSGVPGVVWQIDRNTNALRAFSTSDLTDELWNSTQAPNNEDTLGSTLPFTTPAVANGQVFVGTANSLTVYGILKTSSVVSATAADIKGFSYNRNDLSAINSIQVVIDGGPTAQTILANLSSPELASTLGTTSHDFDYVMPSLSGGAHRVSIFSITPGNVKTLISTVTINSQNSLFNEHYYLTQNPDVAAAVASGAIATGYDHYIKYGQFEGRSPSPYWNEAFYLKSNPDVAAAVQTGAVSSGFMQYYLYGQFENRSGLLYYDNAFYLNQNPDVAAAISAGSLTSGFEHFILFGQYDGRSPNPYYQNSLYLSDNPDIVPFVNGSFFTSPIEHYILYGQFEGRMASNLYNEHIYLADNPDVAAAVMAGIFPDGYQHWLEYGQFEGRTAV